MKHQQKVAATLNFTMEDNGNEYTLQPIESTDRESKDDNQRLETVTLSGSALSNVSTATELAAQEPPLRAEGNLSPQRGTATAGTIATSSSGSGSCSGFDADVDDTDYAWSVASSADLIEAFDNALEALELGNHRERNTFLWIDKCLEKVGIASSDLRKYATDALRTTGIGNVEVQWTISKGGTAPPTDDIYKRRFLAVHEYLLAAYQDLAVQENAKMAESEADTGETESSSQEMGAFSKDVWSVVVNQIQPDTHGETEAKSIGDDVKVRREEEFEAKLTAGTDEVKIVKMDEMKTGSGDELIMVTSQEEVTPEGMTSTGGGNKSESLTTGGAEKSGDKTTTSSNYESDAVEGGHQELTASTGGSSSGASTSEPEEVRPVRSSKHHTKAEARRRAQVIPKLVTRQREALSRIYATAQTRVYRINSVCQFLLTCVNCATCICKSALNAHGLARLALQIAESSGTPDMVSTVREATVAASQETEQAVASCEKAVQLHKDAVRILHECWMPLAAVRTDDLLGERTVGEITTVAEDLKLLLDRTDVSTDEIANKLSVMESMIDLLSQAVRRAKNVNQITKHLVNKFDEAGFQSPVVAAVFMTSQLTIRVMTSTTDALRPLHQLGADTQTQEQSGEDSASQNVPSVGEGNISRGEESVNEPNV